MQACEQPFFAALRNEVVLVAGWLLGDGSVSIDHCTGMQAQSALGPAEVAVVNKRKVACREVCVAGEAVCHEETVCADFKDVCKDAESCSVNTCGGCKAVYRSKKGKHVCTPKAACGGRLPEVCSRNPCEDASPLALQFNNCGSEWQRAETCERDPCYCTPVWKDRFGAQVCKAPTCRDVSGYDFGTCDEQLGYMHRRNYYTHTHSLTRPVAHSLTH
jgi:hypothetical protein